MAAPVPAQPHAVMNPQPQAGSSSLNPGIKHKSPDPDHSSENDAEGTATGVKSTTARPPTKRLRKAVNCEPCRASKLKCDKAHPCSSCVLRGTVSQCYMDRRDDQNNRGIDPHNELARMRNSLATLEAFIIRGPHTTVPSRKPDAIKHTPEPSPEEPPTSAAGVLGEKDKGGFYAGPTSSATLLYELRASVGDRDRSDRSRPDSPSPSASPTLTSSTHPPQASSSHVPPADLTADDDLLSRLPPLHILDGLIDFYFEYCNWMFRHVCPAAFSRAWRRLRASSSARWDGDRLLLATLACIAAIAVRYLPEKHALLVGASTSVGGVQTREALGERYYEIAREAYQRYRAESRALSLELVELLLIRTHYLTLSKTESEEIWAIRGEVVSIGTAMGLHRDPEKWHMPKDVAERRRWAWWHIILLERWQCFLFGRPLSVASHHFDTRLPSYVDPTVDKSGRLYLPNFHLFKLADILGDIVDDAVSVRPVPYERVLAHDAQLLSWLSDLPRELDLDEYRLARALASPLPGDMRTGVQSVLIRASFYHIRFTLHRPYAAAAHDQAEASAGKKPSISSLSQPSPLELHERMARSLDTAASAADKVIQLANQVRPDVLGTAAPAVPVHVHWGPFHCFSAAMFFSFQLIANPEQPGATLFRANIRRVLDILALSRGVPVADRAIDILTALAPLYDAAYSRKSGSEREKIKQQVLALVQTLAFPYQDSLSNNRSQSSPRNALQSPHNASSSMPMQPGPVQPASSLRHAMATAEPSTPISSLPPSYTQAAQEQQPLHYMSSPAAGTSASAFGSTPDAFFSQAQAQTMQRVGMVASPTFAFGHGTNEAAMWGASVGFQQGEWSRFVDVMQRPDGSR